MKQTCDALLQAKEAGLVTIFNPSPIPSQDQVSSLIPWQAIDWLLLNEDETQDLAKAFGRDGSSSADSLGYLGGQLPQATGIVMTKGADGVEMLLKTEDMSFIRLGSPSGQAVEKIVNTTGAGDTFAVRVLVRYPKNCNTE
jgi:ribokinase